MFCTWKSKNERKNGVSAFVPPLALKYVWHVRLIDVCTHDTLICE